VRSNGVLYRRLGFDIQLSNGNFSADCREFIIRCNPLLGSRRVVLIVILHTDAVQVAGIINRLTNSDYAIGFGG